MDAKPLQVAPLTWTPYLVGTFWDYWATVEALQHQYFTLHVGSELVELLSSAGSVRGKLVLDYGCGPGYLIGQLLARGAHAMGADFSGESVAAANARFAGHLGWRGAVQVAEGRVDAPDNSVDIIMCIETIEHMFDAPRRELLVEFRRLLRPGGLILMTTPNQEDLAARNVFCPSCRHTFHGMQHLTSWDKTKLSEYLEEGGFEVEFCEGVDLRRWGRRESRHLLDLSLRDLLRKVRDSGRTAVDAIFDLLAPRPFPFGRAFRRRIPTYRPVHLVAVAKAPE